MSAEMEPVGQHANPAIFAADGRTRHRIVRGALAAGAALLFAWLIALALGVLGGFGSLPSLPSEHSRSSQQVTSPAPDTRRAVRLTQQTGPVPITRVKPSSSGGTRGVTSPAAPSPKPSTTTRTPAPSAAAPVTSTSNGRGLGTTKTTGGKPLGSPGNGPGGSGAPGQLR